LDEGKRRCIGRYVNLEIGAGREKKRKSGKVERPAGVWRGRKGKKKQSKAGRKKQT